ncbi:glycosyltransferase family 52 [uncultured Fusobacterium sp.]|uniref:glycosyltransferase family 52 n=1 Tax=uncultured Fusobacterium sp. TaxID=159267 RepID=UPI00262E49AC|nr:glycosyltransferase family 52 [uncultured Fusobacterium sp.]
MKGVYLKTKYVLILSLIINRNNRNTIYFIDEELKEELNLSKYKVIWLKNLKKSNYLLEKYKKWQYNNKLLKEIAEIDELYLQDHIKFSQFFLNNFNGKAILLEDGTINYNEKILLEEKNKKLKKIKINHFMKKVIVEKIKKEYRRFGLSEKIQEIYLTGLLPIPDLINNKVKIINISDEWEKLSKKDKEEILRVFKISSKSFENLKVEKNKVLLLTQPLSEDKIITEKEKINIYREILLKENGKNIYIKAHPREKTNYKEVFKEFNINIIENSFPIEICLLLDIKFEKVITLFSTGALSFKGKSEVEFIGTEKYPKLYEKFEKVTID